ncbi:MAG: hypothetical protein BJ554DRAFT_4290 [Olpidium bornovanus]|uniref:Integrase zinc-binding domain-containing protein n=1 Tax=Olpidium bornovanus TaxID=278681 RepID=A0A8H7ZMX9_9FUNG|nr:MAG: hypothetical protein BJ554DRAFT_4290 [Olpidium bornovanus]
MAEELDPGDGAFQQNMTESLLTSFGGTSTENPGDMYLRILSTRRWQMHQECIDEFTLDMAHMYRQYGMAKGWDVAEVMWSTPTQRSYPGVQTSKCRAKTPISEHEQAAGIIEIGDIRDAMRQYTDGDEYAKFAHQHVSHQPNSRRARQFMIQDDLLYHGNRLYVPDCELRQQLLARAHDIHHPGAARLIGSLSKKYFWPSLAKDARAWCPSCNTCQRYKKGGRQPGMLHLLPVPKARFTDLAMDAFEPPYPSHGYDSILLIKNSPSLFGAFPRKKMILLKSSPGDSLKPSHLPPSPPSRFGTALRSRRRAPCFSSATAVAAPRASAPPRFAVARIAALRRRAVGAQNGLGGH